MSHNKAQTALSAYLHSLTLANVPEQTHELMVATQLLANANKVMFEQTSEDAEIREQAPLPDAIKRRESSKNSILYKENTHTVETVNRGAFTELLPLCDRLPKRFQALFFDVAGLTLAIPLMELGSIIEMQPLSKLPGKPDWFMGMLVKGQTTQRSAYKNMRNAEQKDEQQNKFQCVDTARWIMPKKYTPELQQSLDYTYAIQLGKTPWVLACSGLATTYELSHDDIKWRDQGTKRPWLAGMIKQKMCALIDASQLIAALESKPI